MIGQSRWSRLLLPLALALYIAFCGLVSRVEGGDDTSFQEATCEQAIPSSLLRQCRNASDKLKTLADFLSFYANFKHVTDNCLRPKVNQAEEPSKASQLAESECERHDLLFYQVRQLAQLIERLLSPNAQVCNIEFALHVYQLHQQVGTADRRTVMARMLRLLANNVALRCRFSLARRLQEVERRAPDTRQHIRFVLALVSLGSGDRFVRRMKPLEQMNQFVPILERELSGPLSPGRANSVGRDGFELRALKAVRMSHEATRMSCNALKLYHVNLLGSLGLLASLGYGAPTRQLKRTLDGLERLERRDEQEMMQKWLLSALLCQSLRTVLRMQTATGSGKLLHRFKVMAAQKADVSLDDETDDTFAGFQLPERPNLSTGVELELATKPEVVELLASYRDDSPATERALARKAHLLAGPNYKLARAIGTYLDVSQKLNRMAAIEEVLGFKLEFEDLDAELEDGDEDEEE